MSQYFLNKQQKVAILDKVPGDLCWKDKLCFKTYHKGRVLPSRVMDFSGGVCAADGSFVSSTSLIEGLYEKVYQYDEGEVRKMEADAVYLGSWIGIYGHAITDNIKKLWFLFSAEFQKLRQSVSESGRELYLTYTYWWGGEVPGYIKEILNTLGLDVNDFVQIEEISEFNNVYVPDNSLIQQNGLRFYTPQYKDILERIRNSCDSVASNPKKVYLSRTRITDGKDFGEEVLEKIFEQRGYSVVYPEKLSFKEQVSLMKTCEYLASTEGSVSHNVLFCNDSISVVLLRKCNWFNEYTAAINSMKKLDVAYVEANHTIRSRAPWGGPFFLWKTKYLNQYLGEKSREKSRWFSFLWYKYLLVFVRFQFEPMRKYVRYKCEVLKRKVLISNTY